MSVKITDRYRKQGVDWDWHDHIVHGYQGGTDYLGTIGETIEAATAGWAIALDDGLNTVAITNASGVTVNARELDHRLGHFPREVKNGEHIGVGGRLGYKFLHMDAIVHGVRVPFESVVTPSLITSAVGAVVALVAPSKTRRKKTAVMWLNNGKGKYVLVREFSSEDRSADHANVSKELGFKSVKVSEGLIDNEVAKAAARAVAFKA